MFVAVAAGGRMRVRTKITKGTTVPQLMSGAGPERFAAVTKVINWCD